MESNLITGTQEPKITTLTRDGLFTYFDQMSHNGRIDTTPEWLADVGMLIVNATNHSQAKRIELFGAALRKIKQCVGTSTESWHIAEAALQEATDGKQ